jgi:malonyl-CoA O-methyltransferase
MNVSAAADSIDRRSLARAFDRAAAGYDAAAWLTRPAREELLQRLRFFNLEPACVLDLGAATCQGTLELARLFPDARAVAVDLAPQMLARAPRSLWRRRFERLCADAYALPLTDSCCDLIFSNLLLPWCERLDSLFAELRRVLRPGGLLLFSSVAPGTLHELRSAWASVDGGPHVNEFADLPQIAEALVRSGFVEPVMDVERQRRHYPSVAALKRELKQLGPQNAARTRPRGLGGKARSAAMLAAYERAREPSGLPATWELLYGAAFAGSESGRAGGHADEQVIPLDRVRRRLQDPGTAATENRAIGTLAARLSPSLS